MSDTRTPYSIRWWDTSPEDENNRRLDADVTQYTFSGLTPGTTYHFVLQPIGSADAYRTETAVVTVRTLESSLAAAGGLEARGAPDFSGIQLRWVDNSYSEERFVIQRRTLPSGGFDEIDTVDANVTEYLDESAEVGVWYEYRVIAERGRTQSSPSAAAGASLQLPTITVSGDLAGWEFPGDAAQFILVRAGGSLSQYFAMDVSITTEGLAQAGIDYVALPEIVTIPAGRAAVYLHVQPLEDDEVDGPEDLTVTATGVRPGPRWPVLRPLAPPLPAAVEWFEDKNFLVVLEQATFGARPGIAFHQVLGDDGGGPYAAPHWLDLNLDGDANDPGENASPLSYTVSNSSRAGLLGIGGAGDVRMTAGFKIRWLPGWGYTTTYQVRARGLLADVQFGPVWAAKEQGLYLTGTLTSAKALPDTIQKWNMKLVWEVSADNGRTWTIAGVSDNVLYASIDPGNTEFETVLDVGTRNAQGKKEPMEVLEAIWADFRNPIPGVADASGTAMSYWGPLTVLFNNADRLVAVGDTAGLVKYKDGTCSAWASLAFDVLRAQSVPVEYYGIVPTAVPIGNPPWASLVKSQSLGVKANLEGQNNRRPPAIFYNHAVIKVPLKQYGGTVFDPSYGTMSESEAAWEDDALFGFAFYDSSGNQLGKQQNQATQETTFTRQRSANTTQ